jgi:hypothetical protein
MVRACAAFGSAARQIRRRLIESINQPTDSTDLERGDEDCEHDRDLPIPALLILDRVVPMEQSLPARSRAQRGIKGRNLSRSVPRLP